MHYYDLYSDCLLIKLYKIVRRYGINEIVRLVYSRLVRLLTSLGIMFRSKNFNYKNFTIDYSNSKYNETLLNERSCEVPIIQSYITNFGANKKILEVGAVLQHYQKVTWDVVDLYEKVKGVINQDICTYKPINIKYDLIVSISTLEHVGQDDVGPKDKYKTAIKNLKSLLKKNGKMIVTVPVGYNKELDDYIISSEFDGNFEIWVRNWKNEWREENFVKNKYKYNFPWNNANALWILRWKISYEK